MPSSVDQATHHPSAISGPQQAPRVSPLVLVVEDHEDTRLLLRVVMEIRGYRVVEAVDGEEGVRLATRLNPAIILMDTGLPRVDGLTATKRIRAIPSLKDVPIIFISGHAQPEQRMIALAVDGSEYFVKPIILSELEMAVDRELKRRIPNLGVSKSE